MKSTIHCGDALAVLRTLPDASVHCCVTSPPYFALRDYGTGTWDGGDPECSHQVGEIRTGTGLAECSRQHRGGGSKKLTVPLEVKARGVCPHCGARRIDQQIGLEETPQQFVEALVGVFEEVRRVLRPDGTCWINLGDSYAGSWGAQSRGGPPSASSTLAGNGHVGGGPKISQLSSVQAAAAQKRSGTGSGSRFPGLKPKDLIGIPWRVAFALQEAGWWLRSDCIWAKPNPMPESVEDRPTKAHEYVFLLTKSRDYFYDAFAVRQAYADSTLPQKGRPYGGVATKDYAQGRAQDPSETKRRVAESLERRGGANLRTVWNIATQPFAGAHSATFPKALADRCIMAGTSAHGCCASCGAPWERVVDSVRTLDGEPADEPQKRGANNQWNESESGPRPGNWRYGVDKTEQGWKPTCDCQSAGLGVQPCVVLDPFTGAGTTGLAATLLGRDFVGCELNPKFADMARKRIADEMPLFARAATGGAS